MGIHSGILAAAGSEKPFSLCGLCGIALIFRPKASRSCLRRLPLGQPRGSRAAETACEAHKHLISFKILGCTADVSPVESGFVERLRAAEENAPKDEAGLIRPTAVCNAKMVAFCGGFSGRLRLEHFFSHGVCHSSRKNLENNTAACRRMVTSALTNRIQQVSCECQVLSNLPQFPPAHPVSISIPPGFGFSADHLTMPPNNHPKPGRRHIGPLCEEAHTTKACRQAADCMATRFPRAKRAP